MSKIDYTALDAAIIERIRAGSNPYGGTAYTIAKHLELASCDDEDFRKPAFRFIDARLQSLRKSRKIAADRKASGGWRIVEEA